MPSPQHIGFLGDIHCGSHYGLWPDELLPSRGYSGVKYLNECWSHLCDSWPQLDMLVLMGDLIDGPQAKSKGTGLFDTDLSKQAEGAIEVIQQAVDKLQPSRILRVDGTPYHEGFHGAMRLIDKHFQIAKRDSQQVIDINLGTKKEPAILNVAHHPMGGSTLYAGTQLDKEMLWANLSAHRGKVPAVRWIVRAHRHFFGLMRDGWTTMIANPCWQLATPHAVKGNYWKWQPDIGGVLMSRDETEELSYSIRPTLYDLPKREVLTV